MNSRRVDGATASERMKQLRRMFCSVYFSVNLSDLSVFVNDICDALGVCILRTFACAIKHSDVAICVAKKREGETELFCKSLVFIYGIETDPQDFRVLFCKVIDEVTEPATFLGSARRICFGVKPQNDSHSAQA